MVTPALRLRISPAVSLRFAPCRAYTQQTSWLPGASPECGLPPAPSAAVSGPPLQRRAPVPRLGQTGLPCRLTSPEGCFGRLYYDGIHVLLPLRCFFRVATFFAAIYSRPAMWITRTPAVGLKNTRGIASKFWTAFDQFLTSLPRSTIPGKSSNRCGTRK